MGLNQQHHRLSDLTSRSVGSDPAWFPSRTGPRHPLHDATQQFLEGYFRKDTWCAASLFVELNVERRAKSPRSSFSDLMLTYYITI